MHVNTIIAGILQRSASDTYMHLGSTCFAKHLHDLEGCGTTYDGIIHKHNPLALDDRLYWRKLHLHALLTKSLRRKNEGTAHILALYETHLIWKSAGLGITLCRAEA